MTPRARSLIVSFLVVAALGVQASQSAPGALAADGRELVDELRRGGLVIFLRHAATRHDQHDMKPVVLENCELQRNLSDAGRIQAREIGRAVAALGIRFGTVLSSPFCRCTDTASLAFGRYERSDALFYATNLKSEQRQHLSSRLRAILSTPPAAPGTNTVVVSHTANLKEAAGLWPKSEGTAHVFRPRDNGSFEHLGEVRPEQWSLWAHTMGLAR